jgi:hypothetical protein
MSASVQTVEPSVTCSRTLLQSSGLRVLGTTFKTTWECLSGVVRSKTTLHSGFLESRMADTCALIFVHVSRLSTDIGFVCFNSAGELSSDSFLHRETNTLQHEPRGFLRDAEATVKLVRANPVLAIRGQPHSRKPFVQSNRRILKDRCDFDRKFLAWMSVLAFPQFCVLKKRHFLGAAMWTDHATRPTQRDQKLQTGIGIREISDSLKKRFRCFHERKIHPLMRSVKYIITDAARDSCYCEVSEK